MLAVAEVCNCALDIGVSIMNGHGDGNEYDFIVAALNVFLGDILHQ